MKDVNRLKYACRKEEDKQKACRRVESPHNSIHVKREQTRFRYMEKRHMPYEQQARDILNL